MIRGSCLCGKVKFEISEVTGPFELCHCRRCRKVSGSAFMAGVYGKREGFRFLAGLDLIKEFVAPVLESPPAYRVFFCSECGSPVPNPKSNSTLVEIPAGTLDDDPKIVPDKHIFIELKAPWFKVTDELPQFDKIGIQSHRACRSV